MWDERYGGAEYFYGTDPNAFLSEQAARLKESSSVLSIGEGEGRNACYLASLGHRVMGVDGSKAGVEKARKLAWQRGVDASFEQEDLATFHLDTNVDALVSIFCHLPSALRRAVYARLGKHVTPGGLFILEAYSPKQLARTTGGPKDRDMLVTVDEVLADFPGWEVLVAEERVKDIQEGTAHCGESDVVDICLRAPGVGPWTE
jgi:SAM-dependent methyltransferase